MCPLDIDPEYVHTKYMLPVLVHIIAQPGHTTIGQNSNISEAQVLNAITTLNDQFAAKGIQHLAAVNTGIQFYLAPVGPDSNGIFRHNHSLSNNPVFSFDSLRSLIDSQYNSNAFIHIFVVDSILMSGIKGYASYPGGFNQALVVVRKRFGNSLDCIGCELDSDSRNKTLAHEMGHFLNLYHTFYRGCDTGDCNVSGDKCCDTPPVSTANYTCDSVNSCSGSSPDLIENFMDYTPESCSYLFTADQKLRMHATLENDRPELIRPDLLFELNPDICFLSAAFQIETAVFCDADSFRLNALPYSKSGVEYIWTVYNQTQNVVFSQSNDDNPLVAIYLDQVGSYDVRLQVVYGLDTVGEFKKQALWLVDCNAPMAHEGANWFFGNHAGLVFTPNGCRPSTDAYDFSPNSINTHEGEVSMSTAQGDLMFYGGGTGGAANFIQMYNANHARLTTQRGRGLEMHYSAAQSSISFACPWDTSKMLLLHSMANGFGGLYYSLIQKNGSGLYELDTNNYNIQFGIEGWTDSLKPRIRESLTAAQRCDRIGHWIAVINSVRPFPNPNNIEENSLLIISIDSSGKFEIFDSVYISNTLHNGHFFEYSDFFQAKFSPDGSKLVLGKYVFDFDRVTGKVSNQREFTSLSAYGVSFSPNSRYLYFDKYYSSIYRVDVTSDDLHSTVQLIDSGINVELSSMQLGPDGKIYIAEVGAAALHVIHYPDTVWHGGTNPVGFEIGGASLRFGSVGGTSTEALPNFVEAKVAPRSDEKITAILSDCGTALLNTNACCRHSYYWIFGDGDTAHGKKVTHLYSYGTYNVKLVLDGIDTLYKTLEILPPMVQIVGNDTICAYNAPVVRQAITDIENPASYQWYISGGTVTPNPGFPQEAFVEIPVGQNVMLSVTLTDLITGCMATDSMELILGFGIDSNTINNDSALIASCELDSNILNIYGRTPLSLGDSFTYQWYVSYNNDSFILIEGQTHKNLVDYSVDSGMYFKRKAMSDFCFNYSNTVEIICQIDSNQIQQPENTVVCPNDSILFQGKEVVANCNDYFEYRWEYSYDTVVWHSIANSNKKDLMIGYQLQRRYFRRVALSNLCKTYSNIIFVEGEIGSNIISSSGWPDNNRYYCPQNSNTITVYGNHASKNIFLPQYQWYFSLDSTDFEPVPGLTGRVLNLKSPGLDTTTFYMYREVVLNACSSYSKTVKFVPNIVENNLYPAMCYDGTGTLSMRGTYSPWLPESTSGYSLQTIDWRFSTQTPPIFTWDRDTIYTESDSFKSLHKEFPIFFDSVAYFQRLLGKHNSNCLVYSNIQKVHNLTYMNQIQLSGNTIVGLHLIDTNYYNLGWQKQCEQPGTWETMPNKKEAILDSIEILGCCKVRRFIYANDSFDWGGECDTVYSNEIDLKHFISPILEHPANTFVKVGEVAEMSSKMNPYTPSSLQWQKFDFIANTWVDLENETDTVLKIETDKCISNSLYRLVVYSGCGITLSDSAELIVDDSNGDFFLWLKDVPADTAAEPNTEIQSYAESYLSPDIIPSYVNTPHPVIWNNHWGVSYLQHDGVFIHTRIRNKGTDTSRGGKLHLYASISAFNNEWDISFSSVPQMLLSNDYFYMNYYFDTLGNIFTKGTKINAIGIDIPGIPPGGDTIVSFLWSDADVQFYKSTFKHPVWGWKNQYNRNAITYYARIEECNDFPHDMTHEEVFFPNELNSALLNVYNNARIARLKSHFLPTKPPIVVSVNDEPDLWDIVNNNHDVPLRIEYNSDSAQVFYGTGEVYVYFDQNLWNAFVNGGSAGEGFTIEGDGIFIISDSDLAYWENLILEPDSTGYIGYSFHYKNDVDTNGLNYKNKFVVKMLTDSNRVCGLTHLHTDTRMPGISAMSTIPHSDSESLTDILPEQASNKSHETTKTQKSAPLVISAQPNPFDNKLNVLVANYEPGAYINIRDMKGAIIEQRVLPHYTDNKSKVHISFNTSLLSSGVYFVQYQSSNKIVNKKVMLVR